MCHVIIYIINICHIIVYLIVIYIIVLSLLLFFSFSFSILLNSFYLKLQVLLCCWIFSGFSPHHNGRRDWEWLCGDLSAGLNHRIRAYLDEIKNLEGRRDHFISQKQLSRVKNSKHHPRSTRHRTLLRRTESISGPRNGEKRSTRNHKSAWAEVN